MNITKENKDSLNALVTINIEKDDYAKKVDNINYFSKHTPSLLEVSIGHALICESLYLGFENVIPLYLERIKF